MKTLAVFDPPLAFFDPVLTQFAADLKWVETHGVRVSRHNFGKEPQTFAANPAVAKVMEAGKNQLPVVLVNGRVISTGSYPSRQLLAQALGIEATPEELSPAKESVCRCTPWL